LRRSVVPNVPTPEKTDESGVDKPNGAGTTNEEFVVPEMSPMSPLLSPQTDEDFEDYLKELEEEE
jgi:hypothetical protein